MRLPGGMRHRSDEAARGPMDPKATQQHDSLLQNRWLILFFSVLSMIAVANFQYGWTLFVPPLQKALHADQSSIQTTCFVFVLLETWLVPFEGQLVYRFGPKRLVLLRGLLAAFRAGWR